MVQDVVAHHFALVFPVFFVGVWLLAASLLGAQSGWYRTAAAYPDRPGEPILRLRFQSGMMGTVRMSNILTLAACAPGLRVAIPRLFGPFCRPFLVPWGRISVRPLPGFFGPMVELRFDDVGRLTLAPGVADRLAHAAGQRWAEAGSLPAPSRGAVGRRILIQWAVTTAAAAAFFTVVPMLFGVPAAGRMPVLEAILFPAIAFGLGAVIAYVRDRPR